MNDSPTSVGAFFFKVQSAIIFVIARELCDRGDPVDNRVARMRACIIYWIASLRSQ